MVSNWKGISLAIAVAWVGLGKGPGWALPSGGTVEAGQATITAPQPGRLVIEQQSDRAILHWDRFDIQAGEQVWFQQPSAAAATLNRVTGSTPATIAGELRSLGTLILVNPNGLLFTETAVVDVGGLLATSLAVGSGAFLQGQPLTLTGAEPVGAVVNRGQITTAPGGYAALIAPQVVNQGTITARWGRVDLAAGSRATVDLWGDGLVSLAVDPAGVGGLGSIAIDHSGTLEGGLVRLTVGAGVALWNQVINTTGIITAQGASYQGGTVVLSAGTGAVTVGGAIASDRLTVQAQGATLTTPLGLPPGVGRGAGDTAVVLTLGSAQQGGTLALAPGAFLRVQSLTLGGPGAIAISNPRPDGLHGTHLFLNTNLSFTAYGFNPSTLVHVAPGTAIQTGINAVANGGTVTLGAGTYQEGAAIQIQDRVLTLQGAGANLTRLDGQNSYQVLNISGASSQVTVAGVTITNGAINPGAGGGILLRPGATLTLRDSAVVQNTANGLGGGIYVGTGAQLTVLNSTIAQNTVLNNTGNGTGGGISNEGGTVTLINTTVSGNRADLVGGIRTAGGGSLTLLNSTVVDNEALSTTSTATAGGIRLTTGTVTLTNTVLAGNRAQRGPEFSQSGGTVVSGGNNWVGTQGSAGGFPVGPMDTVGPASLASVVGPLQLNGGPTPTHALVLGSGAIDGGNNAAVVGLLTDQRGGDRIGGGTVDIGAYEYGVTVGGVPGGPGVSPPGPGGSVGSNPGSGGNPGLGGNPPSGNPGGSLILGNSQMGETSHNLPTDLCLVPQPPTLSRTHYSCPWLPTPRWSTPSGR